MQGSDTAKNGQERWIALQRWLAFQGQDLYLCKLGVKGLDSGGEYIYAAVLGGKTAHAPDRPS